MQIKLRGQEMGETKKRALFKTKLNKYKKQKGS